MTINAERLLKLADYLETVPRDHFNMSKWSEDKPSGCGFSGCAIGWAAHGKLFPGLSLVRVRKPVTQNFHPRYVKRGRVRGTTGFRGVGVCFSISAWQASRLFTEDRISKTPKQVAKRIRQFVRDNQASAT